MSNILFPAGSIQDLTDLDLEMMQYYALQWNLEHTKMEKGLFKGSSFSVHTPHIQIAKVDFSQGIMSKGGFPDGCIVLIFSTTEAVYNFQNKSIPPNEIIMLTKGDEINILTSGIIDIHTIVIEEQLFYKTLYTFFGDIPRSSLQNKRLTIHPDKIRLFHNTVSRWRNYLANELPKQTSTPDYAKIESKILQELFGSLVFISLAKKREKFQTKTVRDLLHEKITQDINISTLTHGLHISESQLHHAFKSDYGITPKKYLQNLRLNAIREELSLAHPRTVTIIDIAQKYNFFHMGHFSQEYKKLFGQTPSQTLHS